jgi:hypothetical protein
MDDKSRANWAKLDADLKKRKADILKTYEEKTMANLKADQERRGTERKAHQDDLQKIMKEMRDANQTKTDNNQEELDVDLKETREEIKSGEAEMKFTVDAFQEKMDVSIANRKDDQKKMTACQDVMEADTEKTEPHRGMMQFVAEHQVALKEDAVVKLVKGRKKRHRDRNPACRATWRAKRTDPIIIC